MKSNKIYPHFFLVSVNGRFSVPLVRLKSFHGPCCTMSSLFLVVANQSCTALCTGMLKCISTSYIYLFIVIYVKNSKN